MSDPSDRPAHPAVDVCLAAVLVPALALVIHGLAFVATACVPAPVSGGWAPLVLPHGLLLAWWAGFPLPALLLAPVLSRWLLGRRARRRGDVLLARWPYPLWLAAPLALAAAGLLPVDGAVEFGVGDVRWAGLESLPRNWLFLLILPALEVVAFARAREGRDGLLVRGLVGGARVSRPEAHRPGSVSLDGRRYWFTARPKPLTGMIEAQGLSTWVVGLALVGALLVVGWVHPRVGRPKVGLRPMELGVHCRSCRGW